MDLLVQHSSLSPPVLLDAMSKGAVWLTRRGAGRHRVRGADTMLHEGELVELHFDERILAQVPPPASCLRRASRYSVWLKPPGLLAQGSDHGDHCSLLRQAEQINPGDDVHLVHRLDRETAGLMLLAHGAEAAGRLSELFRRGALSKRYRALARGDVRASLGDEGTLDAALDGRVARTDFSVVAVHPGTEADPRTVTELELLLFTGRTHQIRRHLAQVGHPVMGDPRHGTGNKNREGLRLVAHTLEWTCPFDGEPVKVALDPVRLRDYLGLARES